MDLIKLILLSHLGKFSKSTWKSIVGVAVAVGLMLFITSKLDSFIVNMEDYMLNFLPEVQFQRTKNTFPTSLKYNDSEEIQGIIGDDSQVLAQGSAFWERGIFQIKTDDTHINKDSLLFSGLLPKSLNDDKLLLNVKRYLKVERPLKEVLDDDSQEIIISKRLEEKLFPSGDALGQTLKVGALKTDLENLTELKVAGVYNNNSVNAIFLSRSAASKITGKLKSKIDNAYIVRLKDKYNSKEWRRNLLDSNTFLRDAFKDKLSKIDQEKDSKFYDSVESEYHDYKSNVEFLSPFLIRSWMDISPENLEYLKITRAIMLLIFSCIVLLSALSIKFMFDTIVLEKRRQISMLKILGYSNYSIIKSFILSGVFIGVIGVLIGSLVGCLFNWSLGIVENYYFFEYFSFQYINLMPSMNFILKVSALVVFLCSICTIPAALKIMRMTPIEGLKRAN